VTIDLLVLGDVNPDLVMRGGDVTPAFGQAERIVEEARLTVGGSGAILACGAARLGLRVAIAGVIGDDLFGNYMREELFARGIDVTGLAVDAEMPTGMTVVLSGESDRAILTSLGTIGDLRVSSIDPDLVRSARHLHVSSFFLQRALAPDLPGLFADARERGVSTSIDPNWDPSGAWDGGLNDLLASVDVLFPNEMEATHLARTSDLEVAITVLRQRGPTVVVKAGDRGAIAVGPDGRATASLMRVAAVDTTGAGDSFDAGFLAARLDGRSLERCLAIANACGALSTRATGGVDAQPTMQEAIEAVERGGAA
jgi:sugar/nucleoside kinase (ribokinase family)